MEKEFSKFFNNRKITGKEITPDEDNYSMLDDKIKKIKKRMALAERNNEPELVKKYQNQLNKFEKLK